MCNTRIDQTLILDVFNESKKFFNGPRTTKERCSYRSAKENFGFQGLLQENLNPNAPADIKSTFTMRNILKNPPNSERWPSDTFKHVMQRFFEESLSFTHEIQQAMARHFNLDSSFFSQVHSGDAISLRLLHYPSINKREVATGQLGAGSHTDYGFLTLLFQDDTAGLEVKNRAGEWTSVTPKSEHVTINSGDLLERWTNGRYPATEHRVVPVTSGVDRFSIALFIDPDPDTLITVLDACTSSKEPKKYQPILAAEHLQEKLEASHKGRLKNKVVK